MAPSLRGAEARREAAAGGLQLSLDEAALEALVEAVAERVLSRMGEIGSRPRWLYGAAAAAAYMGTSRNSVYKRLHHELPHRRVGSRLVFDAQELDEWMDQQR